MMVVVSPMRLRLLLLLLLAAAVARPDNLQPSHQMQNEDGTSINKTDPKIWNSLPPSLRTCTSPDTFRRHLKTHYCQHAFQST